MSDYNWITWAAGFVPGFCLGLVVAAFTELWHRWRSRRSTGGQDEGNRHE